MTLEQAKTIAEIFQSLAIGFGAILGGIGGLRLLGEWRESQKLKKLKEKLLREYPKDRLNKDFTLYRHNYSEDRNSHVVGSADEVYMCDNRSVQKHWIKNLSTLKKLGFNSGQVKGVARVELDKYSNGDPIDLDEI